MGILKFGINFIDSHLHELPSKGVFLFSEENRNVRFSFLYHLLNYNLSINNSCLYLTSLELKEESETARKKIISLSKFESLTILEIPLYLKQFISESIDLYHVLDDLKVYIDSLNPSVIILENIELFTSGEKENVDAVYLTQIMNFFLKQGAIVIIDISNLPQRSKAVCERFASGVFDFLSPNANDNYQLVLRKCKNLKNELSLAFMNDASYNIITPIFKSSVNIAFHECKQIYMVSEFRAYETSFSEIFNQQVDFFYYDSFQALKDYKLNNKYTLVFLPQVVGSDSGWQMISWLQRNAPFCKVLFTDSENLPAHQKKRAIRMGAVKFLNYPFSRLDLQNAVAEIYRYKELEQEKYLQHKILHVEDNFLKSYKSKIIFKNSLSRFIKEYSFSLINEGYYMHFFKLFANEITNEELQDLVKLNLHLVFVSSYFVGGKDVILLAYKNLNDSQFKTVKNKLSFYANRSYNVSQLDFNAQSQNSGGLESINYPLQETDIDFILEWMYLDE